MILPIDEINKLNKRSVPYSEYFGVMNISEKQKKDRVKFSERLEDVILDCLYLLMTMRNYKAEDKTLIKNQLTQGYMDAAVSVGIIPDPYIEDLALLFAIGFIAATLDHPEDEWYISEDRAKFNAENEANTVLNYADYKYALMNFKYKTWHTENDERVRESHIPLEGTRLPIDGLFIVGDTLMRFPKDTEYAAEVPEEYINCRCSITYSN